MFLYIVGLLWGIVSPFIFRNYAAMKSKNKIGNGECREITKVIRCDVYYKINFVVNF